MLPRIAPLRLALDVTALYDPLTGIGVFTDELLTRLAAHPDVAVTAYAVTWRGRGRLPAMVPPGVRCARGPMAAQPLRQCWKRADVPPIEWWTGPVDVVHGPNFVVPPTRGAASVVSVHDLTPVHFPHLSKRDTLAYPTLIRRALARGALVHTVSAFVAAEVVDHFGVAPDRVMAVPNGVSALPAAGPGTSAADGVRVAGGERYVLALGTVEPRKNLPVLVAAFDLLAARDPALRLVVAGRDGWGSEAFSTAVKASPHRERIVRLGYVDEQQRTALLRGAGVFAYPSRYEGFGLPPLEAMSVGTPVVCTDGGALLEVTSGAAEVVPVADLDAETLAAALARVLHDDERRSELVAAGHANVARYSWDRCADGLVELYQRAGSTTRRAAH